MTRRSRRQFLRNGLTLAGLGLLVGCSVPPLPWQQPKVYRVGILGDRAADLSEARLWQAFRSGLHDHGWTEGGNLLIEYRWVEGSPARLPEVAAELVQAGVDILVTRGSMFTQAAKEATTSIPIVAVAHADPEATGHAKSLARPGGNITGLALLQTTLGPKSLEILSSAVPTARRVAVLYNPDTPSHTPGLQALQEAAPTLRVELQPVGARSAAELEAAFSAMAREGAQGVVVLATPFYFTERQRLAELALTHRLALMSQPKEAVEAGGLISYGANYGEFWRRAATHVDKILKGARPGDLPFEQATRFELVINLKTAQALGLTIPEAVLQQATELIQ